MVGKGFVLVGVIAIAALGFVIWRTQQPPTADVIAVSMEDVRSTLAVSGVLEAEQRSDLSSQIGGLRVNRVLVDVGDRVRKGQILVEMEAEDVRAQRRQADAQVRQAQAQQDSSRNALVNAERLETISREANREVSDLRSTREAAATQVQTAEERLAQAAANLERTRRGSREEAVAQARLQLDRAKETAEQRRRERDRAETLFREGAQSRELFEQRALAHITAQKDVAIAEQNLAQSTQSRPEDLRQAEAAYREAQEALDGARRSLRVAQRALDQRVNTRRALIEAENQRSTAVSNLRVAEASEAVSRAARDQADANLDKTVIRAPFDGVIVARTVEPGQTLPLGQRVLRLAAPDQLRVRIDVDEARLGLIRLDENAEISPDAYPNLRLPAKVIEIADAADFAKGTVEVRLRLLETDARLRPDLTVDVNIRVADFRQAVVIPRDALLDADTDPHVLTVRNGVVEKRPVKFDRGDTGRLVITEGLADGDTILATPGSFKPGARVGTRLIETKANGRRQSGGSSMSMGR